MSANYADRLFLAHFAIITFGLVAVIGSWHDPLISLDVLFGLGALLAFMCLGLWRRSRWLPMRWQCIERVINGLLYRLGRGRACQPLLQFIRHAHLACGAPPQDALRSLWSMDGDSHASQRRWIPVLIFLL
jgi:hypothetical protein